MNTDIVSLDSNASLQRISKLFQDTRFSPTFIDLKSYSENPSEAEGGKILYVSGGNINAVSQLVESSNLFFSLLISNSHQIVNHGNLLSRCAALLVLPADKESFVEAINDATLGYDQSTSLLALGMNFIGESLAVKELMQVVDRIAKYDAPVLVNGETGTGKELVARGIHYESSRRDFPFVPVNCGALTDELLLSELFGYEAGAFTDAKKQHPGLVAQASEGTLFLDEIDSLSLKAQTSLLRFLQDQEYRPLGSDRILRSDVRVISATNRNLKAMVEQGSFREDLYYRLKILDVQIPPLRERRSDISLLVQHFLKEISRKYEEPQKVLHPVTEQWITYVYTWPGNVRELENYLHRVFILSRSRTIYVPEVLGMPIVLATVNKAPESELFELGQFQTEKALYVQKFESEYLASLMEQTQGNVSKASRISGKERRALGRLLKKHGIDSASYRRETASSS